MGLERYRSLSRSYYRKVAAAILVVTWGFKVGSVLQGQVMSGPNQRRRSHAERLACCNVVRDCIFTGDHVSTLALTHPQPEMATRSTTLQAATHSDA